MIDFSYTVTAGNVIEVLSILGGGFVVLLTMRSDISALKQADEDQGQQIVGIQSEIKKLGEILTAQARQDQRLLHLEQDVRDMRRGVGFITGDRPGSVDREYSDDQRR